MRAPVVIIGIGGIGSDICVKVESMLPKDAPDRNAFRFVVMDTDVNTLREVRKKGFGGTIIRLSDNMTVAKCTGALEEKSLSWYQENGMFANKPMTEGAGQYRAISRLAFEYAVYEEKINELERVIRQLNELSIDDSEQQIRFYIINSLAGGTGSGIALPLVLYLNRFFMEEFGEANFTCKGFFLLSSSIKQLGGARLEQDSVDANAYAAVKELSAYMRVADSREERYRSLNEGVEKNADMTDAMGYGKAYDYCFLFGMLNQKGRGVHSFEDLKNLVANAVYVQACSPLHDKNSSMEDNTIKHMMQLAQKREENFLSRFGGIGCGELVYPYEKLKKYLAFQWAIDAIGKRWQVHDIVYYELLREQEEKRRQGKRIIPADQGEEYIRSIDNAKNDFLADEVKNICYPEGAEPIWKQLLQKMFDKIADDIEKYKKESEANNATIIGKCDEQFDILKNSDNKIKKQKQARIKIFTFLEQLHSKMKDKNRRDASSYIKLWFVPHEMEDELEEYWLEYYLVREGYFVHPSVVRYFLYQLRDELQLRIESEKGKVGDILQNVEGYSGYKEIRGVYPKHKLKEAHSKLKEIYSAIFQWSKHFIYLEVLQKCDEYVNELCEKFEIFYQSCNGMLNNFHRECIEIADELDRKRGMVSAYVCANKVCREKLFQEIQESPYYSQAGKGFFYQIYLLVQSRTKEKRQQKILYDKFGEYWVENIEKEFGEIINLDILKAIEKQEWYMDGVSVDRLRMMQWIQDAEEKLTNPFLQYMRDDDYHQGISLCCYNSELKEKDGLHREIIKWLSERRGVEDEYYCSPYQLIFYRSFVGLNASRILEYLHEHVSDIRLRRGKAFRAYEKNVFDMSRNRDRQSRVTPHINKKWHNYLELPDTNREYQREMELKIGVVFWYAVITGKISNQKGKYKFFIKETPPENDFNTYEECHLCLYENPYLVKELAISMLSELKKQKDNGKPEEEVKERGGSETETLEVKIKNWENGIFQILIQYNEEVELDKQDPYLNKILLDSLFILVTLLIEGDDSAIKEEWNKILSEEVWEKCRKEIKETERTKEVYNLITSYLKEANVAEVRNLCTRLFFTEMGAMQLRK